VLRNLQAGTETRFIDVTNYAFTDNGTWPTLKAEKMKTVSRGDS